MTQRIFGRKIAITFLNTATGATVQPDGDRLNIGFTVQRTLEKEPSTLEATVFNLSDTTRQTLQNGAYRVTLEAGYGADTHTIFTGDVRTVRNRREGAQLATDIEAGDGEKAAKNWARRWFPKGTTVDSVFRYLASQSGFDSSKMAIPSVSEGSGLPTRLSTGIYVRGYAVDEMYELARSRGLEFSIQDEEPLLLPIGQGKTGVPVTEITERTGLIGYPTVDNIPIENRSGTKQRSVRTSETVITLNHKLHPNLVPGSLIDVKTEFVDGRYRILRAVYSGTLYGDDFNVEIEGELVQ